MRIIAGDKRGIRLKTMDGEETRPTLERVKEGVFSSIQFVLPGAKVLDLFAGSGQMGLEALSRGATSAVFIDESREAVDVVIGNAKATGLFDRSKVACMSAKSFLATTRERFDIIFLDPPYRKGTFPDILTGVSAVCEPGAQVICETEPGADMPEAVGGLEKQKTYKYGTVMVTRYRMQDEED